MSNKKQNILVLDVDSEFLIGFERTLEEEGFNTTTTWDQREAAALLASDRFDVLLVGEHPPEVRTAELLKGIPAEHKGMACIVMLSLATYPFEAQYLCSIGAHVVVSRRKQKAIVEHLQQILRPSHATGLSRWRTNSAPLAGNF